jgi:hypothetical protein
LYVADAPTLRKVDQKNLKSFGMWCWGRMEISCTDRVRNEEVLLRVKEQRNSLHTVNRRKANWIGHNLCRNCFLKHVIERKMEGRIEMTEIRGRFLILNFRRVLNVVCFLLGNSPASEIYMPTFRNTVPSS